MTTRRPRQWMRFRLWQIPAAILAVLLTGFALWLLPRRAEEVVLVDGAHRWNESDAPPQRKIVWRPAEPVAASVADASPDDSLVRPQLAEGGIALYYTLQRPGGEADIYRSQFDGQHWLPGEPVAALNSPAGDYGPVISADGQTLYLYSDRPGGYGGFDLYVSRRIASGWSQPQNLGPQLNTPAHEYDPAITPDGERLFFASNRTRQMDELVASAAKEGEPVPPWKATLRAEPGLRQFDIYVAERDNKANQWRAASNLRAVNTAANEGEPFVSPDGAFLYFASDRPNASGERENYDIYRGRMADGGVANLENLGPGVNTPANEHDPALSPEGFRLVFSSDRLRTTSSAQPEVAGEQPAPHLYALYTSQATETFDDAYWDASHWAALASLWWWIVLALILIGLLAALVWYLREVSLRRAPVPVFFLIALILHFLALTGAFFIPIEGVTIAERISREVTKIIATNVQLESTHQSHADGQQAYEKVADLQSLETTQISAVPRQVQQTPNMPFPTSRPAPTLPQQVTREPLPERVAVNNPVVVQEVQDPQMDRRQKLIEQMLAESAVKIENAQKAEDAPQKPAVETEQVASVRTDDAQPAPVPSPLERRRVEVPLEVASDPIAPQRPSESPAAPSNEPQAEPIERIVRSDIAALEAPQVETEAMEPSPTDSPRGDAPPATMKVEVERQASGAPQTELPQPLVGRRTSSTAAKLLAEVDFSDAASDASDGKPNVPASRADSSSLARQDRFAPAEAAGVESIAADAISPTSSAAETGDAPASPSEQVELARTTGGAVVQVAAPTTVSAAGPRSSSIEADVAGEAAPASAPAKSASPLDAIAALARRGSQAPAEVEAGPAIATAEVMPAGEGEADDRPAAPSSGEAVRVERSGAAVKLSDIGKLVGATKSTSSSEQLAAATGDLRATLEGAPARSTTAAATDPLARSGTRGPAADAAEIGTIETDNVAAATGGDAPLASVDGLEVAVARATTGGALGVQVKTPDVLGGRYDDRRTDLAIGELAKADVDAEISFSPIGSAIDRQRARAPFLLYAQDRIGLQAMLRLRVGDDQQKQDLIDAFGGRKDTLEAIQRGLHWLAIVQHADDGHWDLKKFPNGPGGENYSGEGSERSDTAATGLALLPFLGDGQTHTAGKYQATVAKGIDWLVKNQKDDGDLFTGGEGNAHLYSHGIATIALCEAYGITKDEMLQSPAQRAVDFIVASQHDEGGWRYRPRERGDTSVVGWQVMALKSAQMAGLNVPQATLDKTRSWLDKSRHGQDGREFAYQPGGHGTPAMTAEGLLCMEYLGGKRGEPQLMRSVDAVMQRVPKQGQDTSYYWYYGTQAIFHIQGEPWQKWNEAMSDTVLTSQVADGAHRGTWDPRDEWERRGGRIYSTSLRLLMLEVYFRHLPLYQALD